MRFRLILSFALIVLVSIASMALVLRQTAASEIQTFMYRGGMNGVEELATELENYYRVSGSWKGVEALFQGNSMMGRGHGMGQGMMTQRLRLYAPDRNLVLDTAPAAGSSPALLGIAETQQAIALKVRNELVGYLLPESGMGFIPGQEIQLVNRLNMAALVAALVAGGVALVLAIGLAYGLLRPVNDLTRAAAALGRGNLGVRVPARGPGEFVALGTAFNQMASGLQQAQESRRSMTADIAHELRNPLAVQRAHLEALQDGLYPLTPESLQPILEQNLLLTHLVDDLRTLALADAGQIKLDRTSTDLPALVERIIAHFQPEAAARDIALEFQAAPLPPLSLDPLRVEQILHNLLSNALRHTPEGGKIECQLTFNAQQATLTVHDSGPGIPIESLPHIFERFYRADKSRSRAEGGSGLGLAIARHLAEAHGGTLTAANHPPGGAVFTLTLPISS